MQIKPITIGWLFYQLIKIIYFSSTFYGTVEFLKHNICWFAVTTETNRYLVTITGVEVKVTDINAWNESLCDDYNADDRDHEMNVNNRKNDGKPGNYGVDNLLPIDTINLQLYRCIAQQLNTSSNHPHDDLFPLKIIGTIDHLQVIAIHSYCYVIPTISFLTRTTFELR